jgi:branched-chain amino acid transport system permease protein
VALAREVERHAAAGVTQPRAVFVVAGVGTAAALGVLPFVASYYIVYLVSLIATSALIVVGLDVLMGYAGQVSLGQAGFAAIGAYVAVLLVTNGGLPWAAALLGGGLAAALLGVVVGLPSLRLSPLYIATVTFGFGQIVQIVLVHWDTVTSGPDGLTVPRPVLAGEPLSGVATYYAIVLLTALLILLAYNLVRSLRGRALVAVRESDPGAVSVGIAVARYKTWAFAFGAFYAGVGGALYGWLTQFISPDAFGFDQSLLYVTMAVVGGLGSFWGAILGAGVLTLLSEVLRPVGVYRQLALGACLLFVMLFMPQGIWGTASAGLRRVWRGKDR